MSLDPATLAALREGHVPGDALPGLLSGWQGPCEFTGCEVHRDGCFTIMVEADLSDDPEPLCRVLCKAEAGDHGGTSDLPTRLIHLPLARPEVRHRVAVVMAAGERCRGECGGNGEIEGGRGQPPRVDCPTCRGKGWLRKPVPLWHILPASEVGPGGLPPVWAQYAPELIACSLARVLAGLAPVVGVATWLRQNCGWGTHDGRLLTIDFLALRNGFALLDTTGLRAPWPEVA